MHHFAGGYEDDLAAGGGSSSPRRAARIGRGCHNADFLRRQGQDTEPSLLEEADS
jgi:hypothetical protein